MNPNNPKELDSDIGYIPDMVLNELKHGRTAEVVGSVNQTISTIDEYERKRKYLAGYFGKTVSWVNGRAHIATRNMPDWAINVFELHRLEASEAKRWNK